MRKKISALAALLAVVLALPPAALAAGDIQAAPTASKVYVDGQEIAFDAYNIHDNNYFKLRDLAYVLTGSTKQFDVTWDSARGVVNLLPGQPYTPAGGELAAGAEGLQSAVPSPNPMTLNGKSIRLTAYSINGNNYVKLRDAGALLDFAVDWDGNVVIRTGQGYDHGADSRAAASAMLARLDEYEQTGWDILQARLTDLNGDGLPELFVLDGRGGSLLYWADGALHSIDAGAYAGGSLCWYLCRDAATGELGVEYVSEGGGDFSGGENWYLYLSHRVRLGGYGYFDDFADIPAGTRWEYRIESQKVSKDQYEAAKAQHIRLEALGGDIYDNDGMVEVPSELDQTRDLLNAILAR